MPSECPLTEEEVRWLAEVVRIALAASAGDADNVDIESALRRAARMAAVRVLREARDEPHTAVCPRCDLSFSCFNVIRSRYEEVKQK